MGRAINDSGEVTGSSVVDYAACSYDGFEPAFRTAPNSAINPATDNLDTLIPGCRYSDGLGINNAGQVVGSSAAGNANNPDQHAMLATPGQAMLDLGVLGGVSGQINAQGNAINSSGQIVGQSTYNGSTVFLAYHAFLTTVTGPMQDLGTLGGTFSTAAAINTAGQIVGTSEITGDTADHAFLYTGGVMSDLNSMIDPASGWELVSATGINDNGQIVGTAYLNGVLYANHAVRLDPAEVSVSSLISNLESQAGTLGLPHGTVSSLLSKLQDAIAAIQIGDSASALGDMGALINFVKAQTGKKISAADAAALTAAAKAIIAVL